VSAFSALSPALAASGQSLFGAKESAWLLGRRRVQTWDAPAVKLLASSAARRGQPTKAARLLWDLVVANPRDREMRLALASILISRDQPIDALELLEEMLAQRPDDSKVVERKAFILGQLGRIEESLEIYSRLVAAHPNVPPLLMARGQILLSLGQQDAAVDDFRRAVACDPTYGEAWWALANVKTLKLSSADIRSMKSLLADPQLTRTARINLEFALGKAFEDAREFQLSFTHYRSANELQSTGAFDTTEATRRHVDEAIGCFDRHSLSRRTGVDSDAPIFIVGMPRSGTTLVEQILASHPDVEGTSELPTISAIARSIGEGIGRSEFSYSDLLARYSDAALETLGNHYLRQSAAYRHTQRPFFIDKMPSNWMHVALIKLALPRARIIDVRRDPLDCCFSNYAQNFSHGHEFTHKLEDLGRHYRNYERLMAHFDVVAPGAVIQLRYEQLVEQPEDIVRDLLNRLGLPFADSCMRFYENARPVRTPSAQQVRQRINRRGTGRSRPYSPWLGPLMQALASAD
jgi:tetratricopeptide (TPR) repeat protein